MPLIETKGAASAQGFGEFAKTTAAVYIEDVMSVFLYTGNGSTQTITNGIDLAGKGGLVWIKSRNNTYYNVLYDTARGVEKELISSATFASATQAGSVTAFNANGFSLGSYADANASSTTFASWTFRKQAKFFDVVTYTGNGSTDRALAHSLNSKPGAIIIKRTDGTGDWNTWCRKDNTNMVGMRLNGTNAASTWGGEVSFTTLGVTTTDFNVGKLWLYDANYPGGGPNVNGETYVAYLFAHDAGGFGLTGTDNVISCGSFTVDGSGNSSINLGYEPQWLLMKQTNTTGSWLMQDTMRGQTADNGYSRLLADTSGAETSTTTGFIRINATGFSTNGATGLVGDHIYIAIRRGPMKTPTSGTSVFSPVASSAATGTTLTTNFPIDLQMINLRTGNGTNTSFIPRLTGMNSNANNNSFNYLVSSSTAAETAAAFSRLWDNTGFQMPSYFGGSSNVFYSFRRAPGFFDVVCYTGDGADPRSITHNLTATPELMIVKRRDAAANWRVYSAATGATNQLFLNLTDASAASSGAWSNTAPTSSAFTVGFLNNSSGATYVAYLFASCPGVSKVGSYTGSGTTKQIDCGFTGGARFVLIKRTDSTGDWYVWDSARGIVSGNDPYLLLNSTAAEVTNTDYIDTYSAGFEISSTAPAAINANGGSFVFLAIA